MTLSDFIYHHHLRCRLWIAELNFFINELRIFHESIEYWEGVKSSAAAQKKIGHFKNDFESIRKDIDELKHELHLDKMRLAAHTREAEPTIDKKQQTQRDGDMEQRFEELSGKFNKLRQAFMEF
ncbi:MAG: hypothetical protein RL732_806 [Bacteroidota bacterium]